MKSRTKVLASAAGVLLLATAGGTYALWSDTAGTDDIQANTGHLNVAMANAQVYDVSPKCQPQINVPGPLESPSAMSVDYEFKDCSIGSTADGPQLVGDLSDWYLVPEDEILVMAPVEVDLKGQNILARLEVEQSAIAAGTFDVDDDGTDEITIVATALVEGADATEAMDNFENNVKIPISITPGPDEFNPQQWLFTETSGAETPVWAVYQVKFDDVDTNGQDVAGTPSSATFDAVSGDDASGTDAMDLTAMQVVGGFDVRLTQVRS